ncbi:MAG: hypothetical protein ACLFWR_01585 [Acidimicrobiales bacterium]
MFEPLIADPDLPLRDQVEQAYLFHWEVLMDALRTGRTDQLHLVYAGEALPMRVDEIESFVDEGIRGGGHVTHNYEITVFGDDRAIVMDGFRNHMVEVDAATGESISEPTGEEVLHEFEMQKEEGRWWVTYVVVHTFSDSA